MKIVLSSNIDHYKYTAKSLQNNGWLEEFICGALFERRPWYYTISKKYKKWIDNRIDNELDYKNISSYKIYEITYKLIRNSKLFHNISNEKKDLFFNKVFDSYTDKKLRKIRDIDYFHYVTGIGHNSAITAKEKFNSTIIIDDRAEHKGYLYNIIKDEYNELNVYFDETDFWKIDCRADYEIADYIITPSTFSRDTFINQGIDKNKLVVIPYGCDTTRFYPMNKKSDGTFRVIYVGSLCVRKGVTYLIDAFKKIECKNIELVLIGKIEKGLEHLVDNLPSNIKYIEYVPNNKLNEYYSNSNLFILPSLSDSFSLATLEAMASGLPIIVTENVGAKDFVQNDVNGYIVPIKNSEALKEKIVYLYNNTDIARNMGSEARKVALQVTWEQYEKRITEFYISLMEKNNFS